MVPSLHFCLYTVNGLFPVSYTPLTLPTTYSA